MHKQISKNVFTIWCRLGYASRGIVYLLIGGFAVLAAIEIGDQSTKDSRSALQEIFSQPYGTVLLGIVATGLLAYSSWRLIQTYWDTDSHGTGLKGLAIRSGLFTSFLIHLGLAIYSFKLLFDFSDSHHEDKQEIIIAWLLAIPYGSWLVGLIGIIIVIAGCAHIYKGAKAGFEKYIQLDSSKLKWLSPICRIGLVARGIVFIIIGGFVINAAITLDPDETRGLKEAFKFIESQPYGDYLFVFIAFGLVAFGLYNFIEAGYRRIDTSLIT